MDFRLEMHIKPWKRAINLRERVMLMGSCFTEHMAGKLKQHRFQVLENPHGILFNPVSIAHALQDYVNETAYTETDVFEWSGLWQSWRHHGRFASVSPLHALQLMNAEREAASAFLRQADWLILTLGSAFVYELKPLTDLNPGYEKQVAANCHKVPASYFHHRMLAYGEVVDALRRMVTLARSVNPALQIVFTISPVRHYREGLVENNRSKGLLHNAVWDLLQAMDGLHYFPAYELIMDDLRDYRFFAEDLVHPNYQATQYVWEKFAAACIDEESRQLMDKINRINAAMHHKPRQPESEMHKTFLAKMKAETEALAAIAPFISLHDALVFFSESRTH